MSSATNPLSIYLPAGGFPSFVFFPTPPDTFTMVKRFFSHLAVALFWVLHFLPLPILAVLGQGLGRLLFRLGKRRRVIAEKNLSLCFPELNAAARQELLEAHFQALGRSLLERGLIWWSRPERLHKLIRVDGEEKIRDLLDAGKSVIMLAPHFVGLDVGGVALAMRFDSLSIYSKQKNPVFDDLLYRKRRRFGDQFLLSRQAGALPTIKAMRSGRPFYYLPDMDFGRRDSIFVPFFGVQAATIPGLSRLARAAGASVLFVITRMLPGGQGYVLEIGDPWPDFPTKDVEADTHRMNAAIETVVRTMPEQYYWVHRRFKTRPEGEASLY